MTLKQFNPEEAIRMVQKLSDDFFLRRMAAWKEHNKVCARRGLPAVAWEDFKKVILHAHVHMDGAPMARLHADQLSIHSSMPLRNRPLKN